MITRRRLLGGMALGLIAGRASADHVTELFVSDTNLGLDHGDPSQVGSIAWALSNAEARGGGMVQLGAGVFNTSSAIRVNSNVKLVGSGMATQIKQWDNDSHGVMVDGQDLSVSDFSVSMPTGSSGGYAGVAFGSESAVKWGAATNLKVTGGNLASWGFIVDHHYNCKFSRLLLESKLASLPAVNGMLIHNSQNSLNTGDSEYTSIAIRIKSSAIGLKIISDNVGNNTGSINNNTFSNVQILGSGNGTEQGFVLENTVKRNTFITCDSEACNVNWYIKGENCINNIFINPQAFGGTSLISVPLMSANTFIGGNIT
jgi:hypothetical protein